MNAPSEDNIPFAYPFIGPEEEDAVLRVLRSGWLTTGKETLAFEAEFAAALAAPGALPPKAMAVNSATSGLHLAMEACGVGPGDVVITSPLTFTSTAETARYLGAEVAFADVGEDSFDLDCAAFESCADRLAAGLPAYPPRPGESGEGFGPRGRPRLVAPVHYGGQPCEMEPIMKAARKRGMKVVEDAAHAFPSRFPDGRSAGTLGDVGVFSFYATKTITTGEGGMVVCSDPDLAARISVMRSHGIDRSVWNRYTDRKASWRYAVIEAGYKYNMPDILGALGREQLKRAQLLLELRLDIAARYDAAFDGDPRFLLPPTSAADARHLYPLRLADASLRDDTIVRLQDAGIGVSVHFIPLHTMPYYERRWGYRPEDFPNAYDRFSREISLPLWPGMSEAQTDRVISAVREAVPERAGADA